VVSILASHNVEAIVEQARSMPGAAVERYPVTLKEIFLEHVRSGGAPEYSHSGAGATATGSFIPRDFPQDLLGGR
jgi:hypothetical protein